MHTAAVNAAAAGCGRITYAFDLETYMINGHVTSSSSKHQNIPSCLDDRRTQVFMGAMQCYAESIYCISSNLRPDSNIDFHIFFVRRKLEFVK